MSELKNDTQSCDGLSSQSEMVNNNNSEKLSAEDQQRVAKYLSSPIHSVERKPFRPYFMMSMLVVVVVVLGLLSRVITYLVLD